MHALRSLSARPSFAPFRPARRLVTRAMGVDVETIKPGDGTNYPKKGAAAPRAFARPFMIAAAAVLCAPGRA